MVEHTATTHLIVFESGDDVIEGLLRFARERGIVGAHFHAIGAFRSAILAYWGAERKEYEQIRVREQVEVLSMVGNIGRTDAGERKVHAHVTVGLRGGDSRGGHLLEAIVHPTLEVFITELGTPIQRVKDEATGLDLIEPGED